MTKLLSITENYLMNVNKLPSLATMTPQQARDCRKASPVKSVIPSSITIEDQTFPARDGAQISVRIYKPEAEQALPVIVYYHGGGWVINDLSTCHESCAKLALGTKSIVISVEYRLAPEYKFPIPVYDAHDAFLWAQQIATSIGGDEACISVAGDSAGGNLAAAVSQLVGKDAIASQLLLYPVTDLSYSSDSYNVYEKGYGLDKEVMQWFGHHYIRCPEDAKNPLVAPIQAQAFQAMPKTYIIVAENDVLRDEGIQYGDRLHRAGVYVELKLAAGLVHSYFTKNAAFGQQIDETIEGIAQFLQRKIYC